MKAFARSPAVPAALAAGLAVAGALGWGPDLGGEDGETVAAVDRSPSCLPPEAPPPGALAFADSDLSAAIRGAVASRPGVRRVVLYTDACDPSGAPPSVPAGVRVDVVLRPRRDDLGVVALEVLRRVEAGVPFAIEVLVGRAGEGVGPAAAVEVRLERDGARVGRRVAALEHGMVRRIRFIDRVDVEGVVRYRAALAAPFGDPGDDSREAAVRVGASRLALVVGEAPPPEGFRVVRVAPHEVAAFLGGEDGGAGIDAILLAGAPLPRDAQEAVAGAVRGGAGLLVIGGAGYAGGALASLLPLTDTPPGGRAVCLVLDFSGSMAEHRDALLEAVRRLRDLLDPTDRVAYVAFRARVERAAPWTVAAGEAWDFRALEARGNTFLLPALDEAARLLAEVRDGRRRLYVVSDGQWKDPSIEELRARVAAFEASGTTTAALVVGDGSPPPEVFVRVLRADDDALLREALRRLESEHPDRHVDGVVAGEARPAPPWLRGAAPPSGEVRDVERFYARGAGESVFLGAGELPLAAAWTVGERVVQLASRDPSLLARAGALLRAAARPEPSRGARVEARRAGGALLLEAWADRAAPFRIEDAEIAARPAGRGRYRARVEAPPPGALRVRYLDAEARVPPAAARELEGLRPREDIAAAIALASGGVVTRAGAPPAEPSRGSSPHATLLLAAAAVVACAALRRSA